MSDLERSFRSELFEIWNSTFHIPFMRPYGSLDIFMQFGLFIQFNNALSIFFKVYSS